MLYAVLVHHILAECVQNNRQAPYHAPAYFLSSSPRGKAPRITPSFPGAGTGRARGFCRHIGWRTWGSGAGSPGT